MERNQRMALQDHVAALCPGLKDKLESDPKSPVDEPETRHDVIGSLALIKTVVHPTREGEDTHWTMVQSIHCLHKIHQEWKNEPLAEHHKRMASQTEENEWVWGGPFMLASHHERQSSQSTTSSSKGPSIAMIVFKGTQQGKRKSSRCPTLKQDDINGHKNHPKDINSASALGHATE